ncbi:DUF6286 domain-containing protein [Trebonia sp.]|uniref:DUF6286 domain-containing protein n=1 Tax=Trebonia sp. TaxID=2767075 RepID=UPI00261F1307|nr:DUF6286 domain-containing protein [Trebonia sp.]
MSDTAGHRGPTLVIPQRAGPPPRQARADAWSQPGARRSARRVFRPRRTIPGVLVAAVLAAAGILGCIWAASAALSHALWKVPHSDFAGPLQTTAHWSGTATLAVASAVAFVGFLLILIGVLPGRTRAIPVASGDGSVIIGVPRRNLRRSLGWLAEEVPGIDKAKVRAGRRSVRVRATTRLRDTTGLREQVQAVVQQRLAALDPLWPTQVKVKLRRKKG